MTQLKQFKAIPGFRKIEDKWVYTDSRMEADIIQQLVSHGFSGYKWHRYYFGIGIGLFHYTPDVHLSILHDGMNRRALVEFKALSATQFKKKDRLRMLASAHFFKDALCFLYVAYTKQWYLIETGGKLTKIAQPVPGFVPVSNLPKPTTMIPIIGPHGRIYWERPGMFMLRKTGDGIQFVIEEVFGRPKRRRK